MRNRLLKVSHAPQQSQNRLEAQLGSIVVLHGGQTLPSSRPSRQANKERTCAEFFSGLVT